MEKLLDLSEFARLGKRSNKEKIEISGVFRSNQFGNRIKLIPEIMNLGSIDAVQLPNDNQTFHTHPRECPTLDDCSIVPPSAQDMYIYALRDDTNVVISKHFTYFIKRIYDGPHIKENAEVVLKFYQKVEKYFDDVSENPQIYHDLFTHASRLLNYFTIYRFDNNICFHKVKNNNLPIISNDLKKEEASSGILPITGAIGALAALKVFAPS